MLYRAFIQAQIIVIAALLLSCGKKTPEKISEPLGANPAVQFLVRNVPYENQFALTIDTILNEAPVDNFVWIHVADSNGYYSQNVLDSLRQVLAENSSQDIVFVVLDNPTWANPYGIFKRLQIPAVREALYTNSNFWTDVEPLLKASEKKVYIIAPGFAKNKGDDGYTYESYATLHYIGIGSGMSDESCTLRITLSDYGETALELKFSDNDTLFDLKTYTLPFARSVKTHLKPSALWLEENKR